MMSVSINH